MAWRRARSEQRKDYDDHTRISALEDDADQVEGRIEKLEQKDRDRDTHEAVEASWGSAARFIGLAAMGIAGAALDALARRFA